MKTAPVAKLKARLAEYLKLVKAGHEILITERGVPVGKLIPLERKERRAGRRERLARAGLLRLGPGRLPRTLLEPPRGKLTGKSVLRALLEERAEGR